MTNENVQYSSRSDYKVITVSVVTRDCEASCAVGDIAVQEFHMLLGKY